MRGIKRRGNVGAKNNPKKTNGNDKPDNHQIVPLAINRSPKKTEKSTAAKAHQSNSSVWIVFFTGLTVVATGIGAYFQWKTSQPSVYLKSIKLQQGDSSSYDIVGEWENSGNSATSGAEARITWAETDIPISKDDAYRSLPANVVPFYIAPKSSVSVNYAIIPKSCLDKFIAGKVKKFYIWGSASYNDSFFLSVNHITRFCYDIQRVRPDGAGGFTLSHAFCDAANCGDGDCNEHYRENGQLPVAVCD